MDIKFPLKLKVDEDGKVQIKDDKPVYIDQDGQEVALDAPKLWGDLKAANNESAERRHKLTEMEAFIEDMKKKYDGIEDPEVAKKAIETIKNLSDKQIMDAGEVERLKQGIKDGYELQIKQTKESFEKAIKEKDTVITMKDSQIRDQLVRGAFEASDYLRDKTVLVPDFAYAYFGNNFAIKEVNGKLRAVGMYNNEPIMSLAHPGELASTEEAVEFLVEKHPQKERIVKIQGSGGGAFTPAGGVDPSQKSLAESFYPTMKTK
jgi:hypothetical protein